jgi:hypothetical protein
MVPVEEEVRWVPEAVWVVLEERKAGNLTPKRPARREYCTDDAVTVGELSKLFQFQTQNDNNLRSEAKL